MPHVPWTMFIEHSDYEISHQQFQSIDLSISLSNILMRINDVVMICMGNECLTQSRNQWPKNEFRGNCNDKKLSQTTSVHRNSMCKSLWSDVIMHMCKHCLLNRQGGLLIKENDFFIQTIYELQSCWKICEISLQTKLWLINEWKS